MALIIQHFIIKTSHFNKSRPSCDYTNTLWLALPSVPVTQYRNHYEKIDKGMGVSPRILQCNGQ